jgi:hypothetical protein
MRKCLQIRKLYLVEENERKMAKMIYNDDKLFDSIFVVVI